MAEPHPQMNRLEDEFVLVRDVSMTMLTHNSSEHVFLPSGSIHYLVPRQDAQRARLGKGASGEVWPLTAIIEEVSSPSLVAKLVRLDKVCDLRHQP